MPRKIQSSGENTQERKTSMKRAAGVSKKTHGHVNPHSGSPVPDGGKWAGDGRKSVQKNAGPEIARQKQTGRGAKTRTAMRSNKVNHPNHG